MKVITFETPSLTIPSSWDIEIKKKTTNTGTIKIKEKSLGEMVGLSSLKKIGRK